MSKQLAKDILEGRQTIAGDKDTLVIVAELCRDVLGINPFTLDDGTPIKDILEMLKEQQADIQELKHRLRSINSLANAPHWRAERRWKIEELSRRFVATEDT